MQLCSWILTTALETVGMVAEWWRPVIYSSAFSRWERMRICTGEMVGCAVVSDVERPGRGCIVVAHDGDHIIIYMCIHSSFEIVGTRGRGVVGEGDGWSEAMVKEHGEDNGFPGTNCLPHRPGRAGGSST